MTDFPEDKLDRIVQADALAYLAALPDACVDAIITDLPYGTTACSWDEIIPFAPMWAAVKHVLKPRGVFVTTASQPFTSKLVMSNLDWFKYEWVWDKVNGSNPALLRTQPFKVHENVLVFAETATAYSPQMSTGDAYSRVSGTGNREGLGGGFSQRTLTVNFGQRYPRTIIEFSNADQTNKHHPTQKPVALYEYLIRTYTQVGDLVLDPFMGSGTTALAARNTGRHFAGCDSSAEYVALANKRLRDTDSFQETEVAEGIVQHNLFETLT